MPERCEACQLTKSIRQIRRTPLHQGHYPFEVVHVDLIHPTHASYNIHKTVFHAVDDKTSYSFIQIAASNSFLLEGIRNIKTSIERQYQKRLKIIHTDNDPIFANEDFNKELRREGIVHEKSVSYNHKKNRKIERSIRHTNMLARVFAIYSKLPIFLWPEFCVTAAYVANRTPKKNLNWKTPLEAVTSEKPIVYHLKKPVSKA